MKYLKKIIYFVIISIITILAMLLNLTAYDMRITALSDTYTGYYHNIQLTADQLLHYSGLVCILSIIIIALVLFLPVIVIEDSH